MNLFLEQLGEQAFGEVTLSLKTVWQGLESSLVKEFGIIPRAMGAMEFSGAGE